MPHRIFALISGLALFAGPLRAQQEVATAEEGQVADSLGRVIVDPASAQLSPPLPMREWFGGTPLGHWTRATGDWNGLRQRLEIAGIRFDGRYIADASQVVRGGFNRRATGRGLLGFDLTLDLAALAGLEGGTAFIGVARYQGREGSQDAGDIQAYSNIDATRFAHLYEAWYEQRLVGERIRLKLGRIDANTEFAVAEAAGGFLNASAGFSPTIYALPTYPDPAAAANLFLAPLPWLSLGAGVFQGTLGDLAGYRHQADPFAIVEAGASWGAIVGLPEGRLAIGRWSHAGMAPLLAGGAVDGTSGWYALAEQRFSGGAATDSTPASGWSGFAKYGHADDRVSSFGQHLMLGVLREAPFGWGTASTGLMISAVDLSDLPGAGYAANETTLEAYLRFPVLGFISLAPDLQYIVHPSGSRTLHDAVVGTLRMEFAF